MCDARKKLAAWRDETLTQIHACRDSLAQCMRSNAVSNALQQFVQTVDQELACLNQLVGELNSVKEAIQQTPLAHEPKALVIDRSILPTSQYSELYTCLVSHSNVGVASETVARLLESKRILTPYRTLTSTDVAQRLGAVAQANVAPVLNVNLGELLKVAHLTPDYLDLTKWLSHDLWDYAAPLLRLRHVPDPELKNIRAEFCALQVADLPSLSRVPDPWRYSENRPSLVGGSECSVHLCRVLQGFSITALDEFELCRTAYDQSPDPSRLHTVQNMDQLPTLNTD